MSNTTVSDLTPSTASHDPLCPMSANDDDAYCCSDCEGYGCECYFIHKARADERLNALVIVNESNSLQDAAAAILMAEPPYLAWEDPVRADERSRKGTCWREAADSVEIPPGAIRVYREAGWFWEMP